MARPMRLNFTKMHGAGNDFVMVENLDGSVRLTTGQIAHLCHRRFGVGADGLVLLEKAPSEELDAQMIYFNADGSRADMCGNAARCFTAFALAHRVGSPRGLSFRTDAGDLVSRANSGQYTVEMTPASDLRLNFTLDLLTGPAPSALRQYRGSARDKVCLQPEGDRYRAEGSGTALPRSIFSRGANVNFARVNGNGVIVRTYERGWKTKPSPVEPVWRQWPIVAHLVHDVAKPVHLEVAGGATLSVDFRWKEIPSKG